MNNLMNEIDFYHSLNFLSLSVILSIISKILINSVIFNSKENDEESNNPINFELFLSYPTLIFLICTAANTIQILIAFGIASLSGIQLIISFLSVSFINGITIWWILIKLRKTSYRRSKILWLISTNIFVIVILLLNKEPDFITYIIAAPIQFIGILAGMTIGQHFIQDAYGEFKQQFLDNYVTQNLKYQIIFHVICGFLPALSLLRISNQIITEGMIISWSDLFYFCLIQHFQNRIITYNDETNLKSNWGLQALRLAKSPLYYLFIYQCYQSLQIQNYQQNWKNIILCDFIIFIISNGITGLSSIKVQKFLQEQKK